jgi:hypothetical protein
MGVTLDNEGTLGAHLRVGAMVRRRVAPGSTTPRGEYGLRWTVATPARAYNSWMRIIV